MQQDTVLRRWGGGGASLESRKEAVMTVPIDKNRCTYLTEKGNRYRNTRWSDSDLCMFHHDYLKRASPRNALNIQVA